MNSLDQYLNLLRFGAYASIVTVGLLIVVTVIGFSKMKSTLAALEDRHAHTENQVAYLGSQVAHLGAQVAQLVSLASAPRPPRGRPS